MEDTSKPEQAVATNGFAQQIVKFLLVGGLAFVLDAALTYVLQRFGLSAELARMPALAASIVFTFFANRRATFAVSTVPNLGEFFAYVMASLAGVAINYAIYWALLQAGLQWFVAAGIGTLCAAVFNFAVYRRIFQKN
jgi:putative flippase GtrA